MATIREVATRARVSTATVSRVLNGDERVSETYRERVRLAMQELGYRPNRIARSLRRRQTETIGLIISDIENPHFTRAVRAIEDAAYREGFRVILCNTDETTGKQRAYLEMLAAEQVVGIILVPADPADSTISEVIDLGIPVVAFDRNVDDPRADAVFADNVQAARSATEHLIQVGRSSIAMIAGRQEIQTGADRLRGYRETMHAHEMTSAVGFGEFRLDVAHNATLDLLREVPELDGLIVSNNLMAIGALHALRAAGKRVPQDVAMVSLDDPPWSDLIEPPLTTFAQPIAQMAESAFDLLLDKVRNGRTQSRFVIFNFALKVRSSSGSGITIRQ